MSHSLYLYISTKESESRDSIRDLLKNRGNRKKKLKELAPQILNKDVDIVSLSFTRGWHLDDPSTELFFPAFILDLNINLQIGSNHYVSEYSSYIFKVPTIPPVTDSIMTLPLSVVVCINLFLLSSDSKEIFWKSYDDENEPYVDIVQVILDSNSSEQSDPYQADISHPPIQSTEQSDQTRKLARKSESSGSMTSSKGMTSAAVGVTQDDIQLDKDSLLFGIDPPVKNFVCEPEGEEWSLNFYEKFGIHIVNKLNLTEPVPETMTGEFVHTKVGEIPVIEVSLRDRQAFLDVFYSTIQLRKIYGGCIMRAKDELGDDWSISRSLETASRRLETLHAAQEADFGSHEVNARQRKRKYPDTVVKQKIQQLTAPFFQKLTYSGSQPQDLEGIFLISAKTMPHNNKVVDKNMYIVNLPSCWQESSGDATEVELEATSVFNLLGPSSASHLGVLSGHLGRPHSPEKVYISGVGPNSRGKQLLEAIDHPLAHLLEKSLPATLTLALMYEELHREPVDDDAPDLHKIFNQVKTQATGTASEWAYIGTPYTFFPLHLEDAYMPSANIMVAGSPKIWIFLPKESLEQVLNVLSNTLRRCFLLHREIFLHPDFLVKHRIPFNVAVQQPGDLIVADGTSAHQGWNSGNNLASAVNYLDNPSLDAILQDHVDGNGRVRFPCVCTQASAPSGSDVHKDSDGVYWYNPDKTSKGGTNTVIFRGLKRIFNKYACTPLELRTSEDREDRILYKLWCFLYREHLE